MRITKTIASEVAEKLLSKKDLEIKEAGLKLSEYAQAFVEAQIPKEVIEAYEKYKGYFNYRREFQLKGNGLNYEYVSCLNQLPYSNYLFEPNPEQAKVFRVLIDNLAKLRSERIKLKTELENAIFNLRTFKMVEENFPEAVPFLPKSQSTSLVVNLSEIRQKLK
jgi:hypothetical protein